MVWNIIGIISLAFGVLGVFLTVKSNKKSRLNYKQHSSTLITKLSDNFYGDIEIAFKQQKIDKLTSTIFQFWNSGSRPIRRTDIAPKAPFAIKCNDECKILTTRIVKQTRDVCGVNIVNEQSENLIKFDVDFLDKNDGFVCEVIHTGENADLLFSGEIIGVSNDIQLITNENQEFVRSRIRIAIMALMSLPLSITILLSEFDIINIRRCGGHFDAFIYGEVGFKVFMISFLIFQIIVIISYIYSYIMRRKNKMPKILID